MTCWTVTFSHLSLPGVACCDISHSCRSLRQSAVLSHRITSDPSIHWGYTCLGVKINFTAPIHITLFAVLCLGLTQSDSWNPLFSFRKTAAQVNLFCDRPDRKIDRFTPLSLSLSLSLTPHTHTQNSYNTDSVYTNLFFYVCVSFFDYICKFFMLVKSDQTFVLNSFIFRNIFLVA